MDQPYNRISENVLFALLLAALLGSVTAPVAADLGSVPAAGVCFAVATGIPRS